jgi:hypothetical protein
MTAPRILRRNLIDEATPGASAPTLLSTLPATNLQTQSRNEMARTTGLASQVIPWTFTSDKRVNMVAVCRHNLTTGGTIQIDVYSDAAMTVLLESSGAIAAFSTANLSRVDADDYLDARFRGKKNFVYYLAALRTSVRGIKITLTDAANPTGYLEASRAFAGEYFEFAYDVGFGSEGGGSMTLTKQGRSDGGDLWSDRGADFETQRLDPDFIQESELAEFLAIASKLSTHTDFWFDLVPGDTSARGVYRRGQRKFTSTGMSEPREWGIHRQALQLEEP